MFPLEAKDNQPYILFASDFDQATTSKILKEADIPFKEVKGRYKGVDEVSYITPVNFKYLPFLYTLNGNQESVLVLLPIDPKTGFRPARLDVKAGLVSYDLGYFKPVDKEYALSKDNYTYDPTQDQYYVAE